MGKIREKVGAALGAVGAAGTLINGLIVWGDDGRLQRVGPFSVERADTGKLAQVKVGKLAIWDRRRRDARRAARRAR